MRKKNPTTQLLPLGAWAAGAGSPGAARCTGGFSRLTGVSSIWALRWFFPWLGKWHLRHELAAPPGTRWVSLGPKDYFGAGHSAQQSPLGTRDDSWPQGTAASHRPGPQASLCASPRPSPSQRVFCQCSRLLRSCRCCLTLVLQKPLVTRPALPWEQLPHHPHTTQAAACPRKRFCCQLCSVHPQLGSLFCFLPVKFQ